MDTAVILNQVVAGLSRGMLLFLVASGLTVTFGLLQIFNFTHGAIYMLSAYLGFTIAVWAGPALGFWVALLVVPILVAGLGALIERLIIRRLYGLELLLQLIVTYGLSIVIAETVLWIYGGNPRSLSTPEALRSALKFGSTVVPVYHIWIMVVGVIIVSGLAYVFARTRIGWIIRAAVQDRQMTSALGINVDRLFTLTFAFGTGLAALAGILSLPISAAAPGMDISMLIEAFAVVIIGGFGDVWGTLIAALLVGQMESLGLLVLPRGAIAFLFVLMMAVLLLRPQGLFGRGSMDLK